MKLVARAPGKVNLSLFLGPVREDGRHELVTLYESVSLADEVTVIPAEADADQVVCAGVNGLNIVTQTLDGLRARGWDGPALRVAIEKRIPVAGGMGGGSADAAAVLRLAAVFGPVSGLSARRGGTRVRARSGRAQPAHARPVAGDGRGRRGRDSARDRWHRTRS